MPRSIAPLRTAAADARFCSECGARDVRFSGFCTDCGAPFDPPRGLDANSKAAEAMPGELAPSSTIVAVQSMSAPPVSRGNSPAVGVGTIAPQTMEWSRPASTLEYQTDALPATGVNTPLRAVQSDGPAILAQPHTTPLGTGHTVFSRYNGVVVWSEPERRDQEVERMAAGTEMTVIGRSGVYLEVELPSGRSGFVPATAVVKS